MIQRLNVRITFIEPLLATCPGNKELVDKFVASKAETATAAKEEIEACQVPEAIENASTIFAKEPHGGCILWDYQFRGFIKEMFKLQVELGSAPAGMNPWNVSRAVNSLVFVRPRRIPIWVPSGKQLMAPETLQRPLRAETMQGPRVALARSEVAPVGSYIDLSVEWLEGTNKKSKIAVFNDAAIRAVLNMGELIGTGQWRGSGGYGKFTWSEITQSKAAA